MSAEPTINPQIYIGVMAGANQLEKAAACSTACGFAKISLRRGSYGCYCPQVSSYGYQAANNQYDVFSCVPDSPSPPTPPPPEPPTTTPAPVQPTRLSIRAGGVGHDRGAGSGHLPLEVLVSESVRPKRKLNKTKCECNACSAHAHPAPIHCTQNTPR